MPLYSSGETATNEVPRTITPINASGTITTAGTAQVLVPANPNRNGGWIQNRSTGDLFISDVGAASLTGSSLKIPVDGLYEFPVTGVPGTAISIVGATAGQAFSARFW